MPMADVAETVTSGLGGGGFGGSPRRRRPPLWFDSAQRKKPVGKAMGQGNEQRIWI